MAECRLPETPFSSSRTTDNTTCCNPKDKYLKTNLTSNCSNSFGLKTSHKRHVRSPIMVPVDYKNNIGKEKNVGRFVDIIKEPEELQDLIGAVVPSEETWEPQKDFRKDYNRTKQKNIEHPQGYYSTPSEKINFTGGYLVREDGDESEDVEDKVEKWKGDTVMYDMTGVGTNKDDEKDEDSMEGSGENEEGEEEEEEGEVDLSDQFEDDKLEPPEFKDKFYKTRPYYKYLKYPKDSVAEASTSSEDEKQPNDAEKIKEDVRNVTVSYKPFNETKDVGFYRQPPQPYRPQPPQFRPYDSGGMYVFRKRSPFEKKRKIVLVNAPRKPKFIIRSTNCNACVIPKNVVRKVNMPMYYYPMAKVPSNRYRHVSYPPSKHHNKHLSYSNQPFPGDPRFIGSGDFRTPGDPRFVNPGDIRTSGDPRLVSTGDFRTSGDPRLIPSGEFRTSGNPRFPPSGDLRSFPVTADHKFMTAAVPGDSRLTSKPNEPKNEPITRHQRHEPSHVSEVTDPNISEMKEVHIIRDTPGGYDDTVVYEGRKYEPSDQEISANSPYRPDPFREVEDEYSERVERLNDLIERKTDETSREIDREYDYWDDN